MTETNSRLAAFLANAAHCSLVLTLAAILLGGKADELVRTHPAITGGGAIILGLLSGYLAFRLWLRALSQGRLEERILAIGCGLGAAQISAWGAMNWYGLPAGTPMQRLAGTVGLGVLAFLVAAIPLIQLKLLGSRKSLSNGE